MAGIEKVKKGLVCCTNMDRCFGKCPYDDEYDDVVDCTSELAKDTLEVIEEQQAEIERLNALLKEQQQKKSKEEVLLAIIGKQSYTDLEKFKQLEELNDEYFNGMLDSIRAVEKLFDDH